VGVDLAYRAGALGGGDDGVHVDGVCFTPPRLAACRMKEDVGVRVLHGADDARRLRVARQVEVGVDGDAHDVELGQHRVAGVERAVLGDVDLRPGQHAEVAQCAVETADG